MKFTGKFIQIFAILTFFLFTTITTTFASDNDYITEVGYGVALGNRNPKSSFYKLYERQSARLDALCKLAGRIYGIKVSSDTLIKEDSQKINHLIIKNVVTKNIAENAQIINEKFDVYGNCQVTMKLSLITLNLLKEEIPEITVITN